MKRKWDFFLLSGSSRKMCNEEELNLKKKHVDAIHQRMNWSRLCYFKI